MPGCFLDTTVVVDAAEPSAPGHQRALSLIKANVPAVRPDYALRELLVGRVQALCDAHNRVLSASDVAAAIASVLGSASFSPRTSASKGKEIALALSAAWRAGGGLSADDAKRETMQSLALSAARLWHRARSSSDIQSDQPLGCFSNGPLKYDAAGSLRGPGDSFNCKIGERCSAATYMYENRHQLKSMIEALSDKNLSEALKNKVETRSRRKALKELESKGPKEFSKRGCRALGDAYFALMCPPGHSVATTNIDDYEPLCTALNKHLIVP